MRWRILKSAKYGDWGRFIEQEHAYCHGGKDVDEDEDEDEDKDRNGDGDGDGDEDKDEGGRSVEIGGVVGVSCMLYLYR